MNIKIDDHSAEVLAELNRKLAIAMELLGQAGENNAKFEITALGAVDTGNLRSSISHYYTQSQGGEVYIGTNVEYAPYVEFGTSKFPKERPFLRNAVMKNKDEYKAIFEMALKS